MRSYSGILLSPSFLEKVICRDDADLELEPTITVVSVLLCLLRWVRYTHAIAAREDVNATNQRMCQEGYRRRREKEIAF